MNGRPGLSKERILRLVDEEIVASPSAWMDITGKPSTFPPSTHTHAAADIVSGTLATARIPDLSATYATTGSLTSEASTRSSADSTLTTNLATETTNRTNADSTLTTNLATESTNRTNADSTEVTNRNAAIATHAALTATHGVAGALVGTTDTQALTHKTLTDATNTFPTFNQSTTGNAATATTATTATTTTGNAGTATKLATARTIDGQSFDGTANITVIAPGTHAATSKTTPVDADELPLVDSAASFVLKKLTWANLKATVKTYTDTLYAALVHTHVESDVTNLTTDLAAKAPLASPTFTGTVVLPTSQTIVTPTIASFANAAHDHSNAAGGGNIPESSVTNLVTDLAAKATTTALTTETTNRTNADTTLTTNLATETTNRTNADALLVPKLAVFSGQYYTNLNYGCYGSITTLALAANTGYFVPIELLYTSGSFTNISLNITATGTATQIKWAIYARSASGNATGNVLKSGTMVATATGFAVDTIVSGLTLPTTGIPNEYNLCFVPDGTVTVTAVSGVRNMYRSGNMLLTVTAGRISGVTFATGFVNSPTYTYTDQVIVPLAGIKSA